MASWASLSLQHLSMTGITFRVFMRSRSTTRSSRFTFAMNMTNFWLPNSDSTGAASVRLTKNQAAFLGAPAMTQMPLGFKTRLHSDKEWFPTSDAKNGARTCQILSLPLKIRQRA